MKYCLETTVSHNLFLQYPNCIFLLNEIVCQEGGKTNNCPSDKVIALDAVARELRLAETISTMDIAVGISDIKKGDEIKKINKQILLVDFKFRHQNVTSIKVKDIEKKILGSKLILGTVIPISNQYLFIFSKTKVNQAIQQFSRIFSNRPSKIKSYCPVTLDHFLKTFWSD